MADLFRRFSRNMAGRDFVVADLHGMRATLDRLLERVKFDHEVDRLFSVGDLVDRGPNSLECANLLREPWFHAVRGNHEEMAVNAFDDQQRANLHVCNGGIWFAAMARCEQVPIVDAFRELPIAIEVDTAQGAIGIVHAECPEDSWPDFIAKLEDEHTQSMALWSRRRIGSQIEKPVAGVKAVICGHTIVKNPTVLENHVFIDLGAYNRRGSLCMVELGESMTLHIEAYVQIAFDLGEAA